MQTEVICQQNIIEFPTLPIVCCCTTLKNATAYTSSQKLSNKSAMHAVISLLLQSGKFWWYPLVTSSMLLHDVIMTSYYCCQRYPECLVMTLFQQDSAPAHCARPTVELLHQEMLNFLAPNLWPLNSADLSPVDYEMWTVMQHCVYHRQIHSDDELKQRLIMVSWSWTVNFWRGYWPMARETSSVCPG